MPPLVDLFFGCRSLILRWLLVLWSEILGFWGLTYEFAEVFWAFSWLQSRDDGMTGIDS